MALVVVAALARVEDEAAEVALDNGVDVALAAADDAYVVALELCASTITHISCKHKCDAHLLHHSGDVRLAATALWRVKTLSSNYLSILDVEDGVVSTMAEMVVYVAIACWNSKTHTLYVSGFNKKSGAVKLRFCYSLSTTSLG